MSKTTDIITMARTTITSGNEHMHTMRNAVDEEDYTDGAAALADQWIRLTNLFEDLVRETQQKP